MNYPKVTDFLSYSVSSGTHTLSVQTNDVSLFTNAFVTFYVRVVLVDYYALYPQYAIHWEPFRFRLKHCQVASFSWTPVDSVYYNLYTPIEYVEVPEFSQVPTDVSFSKSEAERCGYAVTYSASWLIYLDSAVDLPPFILWNDNDRRFEIFSDSPSEVDFSRQYYTIQLTASISESDMNPPFADSL